MIERQLDTRHSTLSRVAPLPSLIVFCAGINLILVQWTLVRELTALLLGTELVTLLVGVAYFTGLSVGYKLSSWIRRTWLPPLALITLLLNLSLPIWFRLVVIALDAIGADWAAFVVLPGLTPFIVPAFYSIFLPLMIDGEGLALPRLYALELLGSAAGVLALVVLGAISVQAVDALYAAGVVAILFALRASLRWVIATGVLAAGWIVVFPAVNLWSNSAWYIHFIGLPTGTTTLLTKYSPYQKVDVMQTPDGTRFLYLDSLEHFGSLDESRLNVAMGQTPASLTKPENALVIGAGSMEMDALIADYAEQVTTVEIDPVVVDASLRYFDSFNRMSVLSNRRIVIDDAKHYFANATEDYDLIAMDVPAAYGLQTATLYSAPFYGLIAQHLTPNGVLVANLTSTFAPGDLVSRRIAASLLANFEQVMVYTPASAGWSFALAAHHLPIDQDALAAALRANGEAQFVIYDTPAVRAIVGDAAPITLDSMDIVLQTSARWIAYRMRGD